MKPLTLEIHGANAHNRGSELSAIAVAEQVRARVPNCRIVVPPSFGSFQARAKHLFLTTWEMPTGVRTKNILRFAPLPLKRAAGLVDPKEIDVVLDVSDYSLSDDITTSAASVLLTKMTRRDRRHQVLALLPQGLGPFTKPNVTKVARALMERASIVCARDDVSFAAATTLVERSKVRRFPDVTATAPSQFPHDFKFPPHFSAIVPSSKVLKQSERPEDYLEFLTYAANALRRRNLNPVIVLHHRSEDRQVVDGLAQMSADIPVWDHEDARALRAIIGRATLVVGSRYHALLNGLMQGVPCIAAGWSHIFRELLREFDSEEMVVPDPTNIAALDALLNRASEHSFREQQTQRILQRAERVRDQVRELWSTLDPLLMGESRTM